MVHSYYMISKSLSPPEPKPLGGDIERRVNLSVVVTEHERNSVRLAAAREGTNISYYIRTLLEAAEAIECADNPNLSLR